MINQIITNIKQDLSQILTPDQMEALSQSLNKHLPMLAGDKSVEENTKHDMLPLFITFAEYNALAILKIQIRTIELNQFTDTNASRSQ